MPAQNYSDKQKSFIELLDATNEIKYENSSLSSNINYSLGENLSFGNFLFGNETRLSKSVGGKGSAVRKIFADLKKSQRFEAKYQMVAGTESGEAMRKEKLLDTITRRIAGEKIRDDPKRLLKTLNKRKKKKIRSAKKWEKRKTDLKQNIKEIINDRLNNRNKKTLKKIKIEQRKKNKNENK